MKIVFLFYEGMTALDAIGPHEILSRLPNAEVYRVAKKPGLISTDSGLLLNAEYSFLDISNADILFVPGAGNATTLREYSDLHDWIRRIHLTTQWTTSVCTGSLILGSAGLLSGLKATTHWAALDRLKNFGAIPIEKRIVENGKIITAAGVSAGIDMALFLAGKIAGANFAKTLQLGLEYDPEPPFDAGSPKKAAPEIVNILRTRLLAGFEKSE